MIVRYATEEDWSEWHWMRVTLWPHATTPDDEVEMRSYLAHNVPDNLAAFVAQDSDGKLIGFVEVSIRDYAEGCPDRHVGYIEGWYVKPEKQRQGVGVALVRAAEEWARRKGCREMASDCELSNSTSLAAHSAIGYEEVERLIHFRKTL